MQKGNQILVINKNYLDLVDRSSNTTPQRGEDDCSGFSVLHYDCTFIIVIGSVVVDLLKNKRRHVGRKKSRRRPCPKTPVSAETSGVTETPVSVEIQVAAGTPLLQVNTATSTISCPTENDVDNKTKAMPNDDIDYRLPLYFPSLSPPSLSHSFPHLPPPSLSPSQLLLPPPPSPPSPPHSLSPLPPQTDDIYPHQQHSSTQRFTEDQHCQYTKPSLQGLSSLSRLPPPTSLTHITTTAAASTPAATTIQNSADDEPIDPVKRFVKTAKMFAIECSRRRRMVTDQGDKSQTVPVDDDRIKRMMTMAISAVVKRGYDYDGGGWKLKKTPPDADDGADHRWSEQRWQNAGKGASKYAELEQPVLEKFNGVAGRQALNSKGTHQDTDESIANKTPVMHCIPVVATSSRYVDIVYMRLYL